MARELLLEMARENLAHVKAGDIPLADEVVEVPAEHYYDEARWKLEVERVFKRMPLMLAMTCELPNPGDYKAMDAAHVPVIISRGQDGKVRGFANICSHRGSQILPVGTGNAKRFSCPYHAWTYNDQGELVAILSDHEFGEIDRACHHLPELPTYEIAGLIWVTLDPESPLETSDFLCGFDALLARFGFETWHFFDSRRIEGPNWKIAYDGYMDLYHLPVLHRNTFGTQMSNQAIYRAFGPHQRVSSPNPLLLEFEDKPDDEWDEATMLMSVWTIFPHVSIASFDGGGRGVMISQLFPGDTPSTSYTVQNYLMEKPPSEAQIPLANEQFKLLEYVVREEDYATGIRQQKALETGLKKTVMFGRNEAGGQCFHAWLDKLLHTDDRDLPQLFQQEATNDHQAL